MKEFISSEEALKTKNISFLGLDAYDYLLYLAKLLTNMNYKVLVIDLSENGATSEALHDTSESIATLLEPSIFHCKGIDYIPQIAGWNYRGEFINSYLYHKNEEYDYVMTDFGTKVGHTAILQSAMVCFVIDMQKHNILAYNDLIQQLDITKEVVIRNIVPCKIKAQDLIADIIKGLNHSLFYMELREKDLANQILLQHTRVIPMNRISKQVRGFLLEVVKKLEPEKEIKEIEQAFTLRGK